jgi:hypothetical protein
LIKLGILPEFRTTKAMQKTTANENLMTGEDCFGKTILRGIYICDFLFFFLPSSSSTNLLMDDGIKCFKHAYLY